MKNHKMNWSKIDKRERLINIQYTIVFIMYLGSIFSTTVLESCTYLLCAILVYCVIQIRDIFESYETTSNKSIKP